VRAEHPWTTPPLLCAAAALALAWSALSTAGCGRVGPGASMRPAPVSSAQSTGSGASTGTGYQGFQISGGCVTVTHSGGSSSHATGQGTCQ
jgi:hypothetical protein